MTLNSLKIRGPNPYEKGVSMIYLKNVRFEPLILKIIKNLIIIELSLESCKEWSMQLFLPLGQNKNQVKQIFDKKKIPI